MFAARYFAPSYFATRYFARGETPVPLVPVASWPVGVPTGILVNGYQESLPDQTIESQVETGGAKVRRRYTANFEPISGTIRMTSAQLTTFRTWFLDTLDGGSLPFSRAHPRTGDTVTMRFRKPPPRATPIGGMNFDVAMSMEQIPS